MCVIDIPEGCDEPEDELFNAPIQMPLVLFNPEIIAQEGSQRDKEGCLSFPNVGGSLTRAAQVTCQYLDADNRPQIITARGFLARALQALSTPEWRRRYVLERAPVQASP